MKKLIVAFAVVMVICLTGCGTTYQEATWQTERNTNDGFCNGYFTIITQWGDVTKDDFLIVYANDTRVKYLIMYKSQVLSGITPLYNADGTLQID